MSLTTRYAPEETEDKWYQHWTEEGYFHSTPDDRPAYSIVIPPPNVTGVLHMGHMLNNTIQDILIRKARLDGKNACWGAGTDHASIATEAKVVRMLREKGIKKGDLTREEFLEHAWEWTDKYGGIILQQLKKLGASCDWERTAFTMDEVRSKQVIKVFVDLYNKGKLYRGLRMVNWDLEAQTVLSNEEVLHKEENAKLYHVRYQVEGTDEWITIATQRPETIMGDTAIAVNPEDERYAHLKGKRAIVPVVNRSVPIIFDDYVDKEFGTGALKVTPAHDPNDYEIGLRHKLEVIDTINLDGTLNENAQIHVGLDRFEARKLMQQTLEESGNFVKTEDYVTSIGRSERTNAVVEPKLSKQWYVDMKQIAPPALEAVLSDDVEFFPKKYKNTYRHWMENIRDWCISRQLWWGHRIPAWYYGEELFVAETGEEALKLAQAKLGKKIKLADLKQEEDVLDTWFSSWLWPFSVFDGMEEGGEVEYYYPTSVVVTGWDIIFLWIARMIMSGYEWKGTYPFKDVYFTGMVRDKQRRKMSKSLGNSPDALELIERFGADGVRFGMMSCSPAGGDLLFDDKLCQQGRNFCNKMWNALRLIKGWEVADKAVNKDLTLVNKLAARWFKNKLSTTVKVIEGNFKEYRLSEAVMELYNFIWGDFFSWYLEMIKPPYGSPIDKATQQQAISFFEQLMTTLHPVMPFVTEEIWHQLATREKGDDCMSSAYPKPGRIDKKVIKNIEVAKDVISKVRDIRQKNNLKKSEPLKVFVEQSDSATELFKLKGVKELIEKMAVLESLTFTAEEPANTVNFIAGTEKYYVELLLEIDEEAERARIEKELAYNKGFLISVDKKLGNERFVNNAPKAVVEKELQKKADAQAKIAILEESLAKLGGAAPTTTNTKKAAPKTAAKATKGKAAAKKATSPTTAKAASTKKTPTKKTAKKVATPKAATKKETKSTDTSEVQSENTNSKAMMSLSRKTVIYAKTVEDRKLRLLGKGKPTTAAKREQLPILPSTLPTIITTYTKPGYQKATYASRKEENVDTLHFQTDLLGMATSDAEKAEKVTAKKTASAKSKAAKASTKKAATPKAATSTAKKTTTAKAATKKAAAAKAATSTKKTTTAKASTKKAATPKAAAAKAATSTKKTTTAKANAKKAATPKAAASKAAASAKKTTTAKASTKKTATPKAATSTSTKKTTAAKATAKKTATPKAATSTSTKKTTAAKATAKKAATPKAATSTSTKKTTAAKTAASTTVKKAKASKKEKLVTVKKAKASKIFKSIVARIDKKAKKKKAKKAKANNLAKTAQKAQSKGAKKSRKKLAKSVKAATKGNKSRKTLSGQIKLKEGTTTKTSTPVVSKKTSTTTKTTPTTNTDGVVFREGRRTTRSVRRLSVNKKTIWEQKKDK